MRVAVFSNVHGNLAALEAVLADIRARDVRADTIVCTGDLVGHGPRPNEVLDLLRQERIELTRGNYDEYFAGIRSTPGVDFANRAEEVADGQAIGWTRNTLTTENLQFLKSLRRDARVQVTRGGHAMSSLKETPSDASQEKTGTLVNMLVGGVAANLGKPPKRLQPKRLLFVHGSPRESIEQLRAGTAPSILRVVASMADADVIVHGHSMETYQRVVDQTAFIGVGAVGFSAQPGRAEYTVLELIDKAIDVEPFEVEYDYAAEARLMEQARLPSLYVSRMREGTSVA